jgi:hypothetical protein
VDKSWMTSHRNARGPLALAQHAWSYQSQGIGVRICFTKDPEPPTSSPRRRTSFPDKLFQPYAQEGHGDVHQLTCPDVKSCVSIAAGTYLQEAHDDGVPLPQAHLLASQTSTAERKSHQCNRTSGNIWRAFMPRYLLTTTYSSEKWPWADPLAGAHATRTQAKVLCFKHR